MQDKWISKIRNTQQTLVMIFFFFLVTTRKVESLFKCVDIENWIIHFQDSWVRDVSCYQ